MMLTISLSDFTKDILDKSWYWLNDPEIKRLTNTPDFTREQQRQWFKNLSQKKDYLIWGVLADSNPIGVCGLKNITKTDAEYWGYIGEKAYWGKGIGKEMMKLMKAKAKELGLESIWLEVIKENYRAIGLYEKVGYINEDEMTDKKIMRKYLVKE